MENADESLIEHIYDTALDPARLDVLVGAWALQAGSSLAEPGVPQQSIEAHLHKAFDVSDRLFETADSDTAQPVLSLSSQGTIVSCNAPAARAYGVKAGDRLTQLPFDSLTVNRLQSSIAKIRTSTRVANLISGQRTDCERTVVLALESVGSTLTLQTTDFVWSAQLPTLLKDAFELTKAEVEVVKLLSEGSANNEIAASRKTSVETVRAQVRAIYGKTGVHGVGELTRLVLGLASFSLDDVADSGTKSTIDQDAPYPRAKDRHVLTLPDGRLLDYSTFGATDGQALLFLHDERTGDAWTAQAVNKAIDKGLRVVAPARPCYGRSDELPKETPERRIQVAQDMVYLLDYLGYSDVVILARGLGSGTAMALSSEDPDRVRGIVAVSPALPVLDEDMQSMHPFTRIMIHSLFNNPSLARFVVQAWLRLTQKSGVKESLTVLYKDQPLDLANLDNPAIMRAIELGAKLTRGSGYKGFLGEIFDVPAPLERCALLTQSPTTLVIGEYDPNSRKQRADRLAAMSNEISVLVFPDVGEMFFYTHHDELLSLARQYF